MILLGVSGKLGVGKNYITEHYIVPKLIRKLSNNDVQSFLHFFAFLNGQKFEKTKEFYSRFLKSNLLTVSC